MRKEANFRPSYIMFPYENTAMIPSRAEPRFPVSGFTAKCRRGVKYSKDEPELNRFYSFFFPIGLFDPPKT